MMKLPIFIFLLLLSSTDSFSFFKKKKKLQTKEQCSDVTLKPRTKEIAKRFSGASSQGAQGWCHSYTAADLISWEVGRSIPAMHLGIVHSEKIARNPVLRVFWPKTKHSGEGTKYGEYRGGSIGKNIKNARGKYLCLERDLDSDDSEYYYTQPYREVFRTLDHIKYILSRNEEDPMDYICSGYVRTQGLENIDGKEFKSLVYHYRDLKPRDILNKIIERNCKNRIKIPSLKLKNMSYSTKALDQLNKNLDNNKLTGMNYDSRYLTNPNKPKWKLIPSRHISSVRGRRWNRKKGRCEYKVRNSWGSSCRSYIQDIDCEQKTGSLWVGEERFSKMVKSISYIK